MVGQATRSAQLDGRIAQEFIVLDSDFSKLQWQTATFRLLVVLPLPPFRPARANQPTPAAVVSLSPTVESSAPTPHSLASTKLNREPNALHARKGSRYGDHCVQRSRERRPPFWQQLRCILYFVSLGTPTRYTYATDVTAGRPERRLCYSTACMTACPYSEG